MKNLKRILSLALASVMVMGMMVVGASAAEFTDKDQIDPAFTEAVDLLHALKVMQGNDDGTLDPKGELNRAQAATLLSILLNKGKAPTIGLPTTPIFTDVRGTANNWAETYINYCYNLGAVNGTGNNQYSPANPLTSTQWARMILNVLGIKLESATNWELNTEIQARDPDVNLYAGLDDAITDTNAAITREQAAQMLVNGMKYAPESTGTSYVVKDKNGTQLYKGTDPITALLMFQSKEDNTITTEDDLTGSILKETFGVTSGSSTDAFGRTVTKYTQGSKTILTIGGEADLTYTTAVTMSKLYNDLDLDDTETAKYILNGHSETDLSIAKADTTNTIGGNGSTVEVYVSSSEIKVVQVDTFAAKITEVTEAKAATATTDAVTASVKAEVLGAEQVDSKNIVASYKTTGYEKGDIVLVTGTYTVKGGEGTDKNDITGMTIRSMTAAPFVVGTVSATAKDYIRVDGEKYNLSNTNAAVIGTTAGYKYAANADQYTYYLDATGSIITAVVGAAAEDNSKYIYVIDVAAKAAGDDTDDLFDTTSGAAAVAQAKVIDLETGAVSVKNLAIVKTDDGYFYADKNGEATTDEVVEIKAADASDKDNTFCKYVELDNGDIVLTTKVNNVEVTVEQDKAELGALDTGYANNTTKVTIYEKDAKGKFSSKSYTGIANFPATAETFKKEAADPDAKKVETYAVIVRQTGMLVNEIIVVRDVKPEASSANYAIFAGEGETGSDGTALSFYVDGELKNYYTTADATIPNDLAADEVVNLTFEGTKVKEATKVTKDATVTVEIVEADYFVVKTADDKTAIYYFASDCVTVDAGDDYKTAEIVKGDTIDVFENDDGNIAFIIIAE